MKPLTLIPSNTKIDFISKRWGAFILSIILILSSIFLIFTKGLNFGIDFTGGTVIELRSNEKIDISSLRSHLKDAQLGEIALQNIGSDHDIMIRVQKQEGDHKQQMAAVQTIKNILSDNIMAEIDYRKVDFVGPQVGSELIYSGAISLLLAFLAINIYIWFRFEWQFGIGAIVALIHDALLTVGLFSLLQIEFNLTSIAAILTIIGYSINDSVVIFDRIRENMRKFKKISMSEILNKSVNDTLSRTILTAGTTIAAVIALVTLGGDVIKGFSIAVLFGVIIGTYSSVYIASPILIYMGIRKEKPDSESTSKQD